jgi:hypothetical protein
MSRRCSSCIGVGILVGGRYDSLGEVGVFVELLLEGDMWRKSRFYLR